MKKNKEIYSEEELELVKKVEKGDYEPLSKKDLAEEKVLLQQVAENTMKRKSISIRVFESDIKKIKSIALSEGIPYQTFITSILHKVATGREVKFSV